MRDRKGNGTGTGARRSQFQRYCSCKQDAHGSASFLVAWKQVGRRSVLFLIAEVAEIGRSCNQESVVPGCLDTARAAGKATGQHARGASLKITEARAGFQIKGNKYIKGKKTGKG
ncbi:hypothetical protein NDU88_001101 [Pleurodeles waltl]|uniref:Uncharacterized protein n=1 Tax=Pleurodeles waltl TaxID=8319 RepID=A0AAV7RAN3_PLEWA|nr:hypothetical protein NDU88_001101 [Pleurodeles waltl]